MRRMKRGSFARVSPKDRARPEGRRGREGRNARQYNSAVRVDPSEAAVGRQLLRQRQRRLADCLSGWSPRVKSRSISRRRPIRPKSLGMANAKRPQPASSRRCAAQGAGGRDRRWSRSGRRSTPQSKMREGRGSIRGASRAPVRAGLRRLRTESSSSDIDRTGVSILSALDGRMFSVTTRRSNVVRACRYRAGSSAMHSAGRATDARREADSLADVAAAYLNVSLDKTAQTSDWAPASQREQIDYAALDAVVEWEVAGHVFAALRDQTPLIISNPGHRRGDADAGPRLQSTRSHAPADRGIEARAPCRGAGRRAGLLKSDTRRSR